VLVALTVAVSASLAGARIGATAAPRVGRRLAVRPPTRRAVVRTRRSYWGAWIGSQFTGAEAPFDMNALSDFEKLVGKQLSTLNWSSPAYDGPDCGGYCRFQKEEFNAVRAAGVIPFFSWSTAGAGGSPLVTDAQVAAGALDGYITAWARAAKAWGHPFFLRFDWEMNGSWFPWGVGRHGNTAADYVAMWRHVHDIFTSVGATNVTWVWCPDADPTDSFANLATLYPGNRYVDWTCLDGYNEGRPWTSFAREFGSTYEKITGPIAPSKPVFIGEVASTTRGSRSKARWIIGMFGDLATRFAQVRGVQWFDQYESTDGGPADWPIETSTADEAAFANGIRDGYYESNDYASLRTSPIPVPTGLAR